MTEQTLPNGLPPQFGNKPSLVSTNPFNGMNSSHSSRTSSPANRLHQIPASQLPPSRTTIPTSQLPPNASMNQLVHNYTQLSVSNTTPMSSPIVQSFTTSTPILNAAKSDAVLEQKKFSVKPENFNQKREFSPIVSSTFSHSAHSQFTNIPLSINSNNQSKSEVISTAKSEIICHPKSEIINQTKPDVSGHFQNVPLGNETKDSNIVRSEGNNITTGSLNITLNNQINTQLDKVEQSRPKTVMQDTQIFSSASLFSRPNASSRVQETHEFKNIPLRGGSNLKMNQQLPEVTHQQQSVKTSSQIFNSQQNLTMQKQVPFIAQNDVQAPLPQMPSKAQTQPIPSHALSQPPLQSTYTQQTYKPGVQTMQNPPVQPNFASQNPLPNSSSNSLNTTNIQSNISTSSVYKTNLHSNRYPTTQKMPYQNTQQPPVNQQTQNVYNFSQSQPYSQPITNYNQNDNYQQHNYNQSVVQGGYNRMWVQAQENYDLLQCPNILPPLKVEPPKIKLGQDFLDAANCSPDIFRCTMTKIPENNSLLQKSRLPLGILIHPFKDLDLLPVIQCSTIVRCRACRTYINPFVFFVDMKRWKCNLCYRVNELPEEFQFDPVSKTYGDPSRRPEIKSSTIEYIAPSEYTLRPPQPAVYLFLLDVSHAAIESEYLHVFCNVLTSSLSNLPGDARTQIGFIAFNSALHFYSLADGLNQPHEMTVLDIDDVFLPCPDNLIVNLNERKELITDLLAQLPTRFNNSYDTGCALGAALQAAHKMIAITGGRITVFQASLPTIGPGALTVREDPSQRTGSEVYHLNPANDFYKRLALECSGQQIAVDLFIVNSQYVDLATISGISRFSGGCIHHFPLFKASRILQATSLERTFRRYLTRKIGFEAVMRIRCTRGLSIHTFHGNFFVRSTDLLSLPNINPEAGFGMQVAIEESLSDLNTVCFQAALLYTSYKGERRIRVHTLCVPVASTLSDIITSADQQCIVGLLSKMAVDRSMQSTLSDAREAFINVAIDILSSYKLSLNLRNGSSGLLAPNCLKLLPLYISALLKFIAFRTSSLTRLDDRVKAMCDMKTLPLYFLIQKIYPDLYPVHNLEDQNTTLNVEGEPIPQPPRLQLSARSLESKGAFLMDMGEHMVLLVGQNVSSTFLKEALGVSDYNSISEEMFDLPNLETLHNQRLSCFINYLNNEKPFVATLQIIRENSVHRHVFIERLIEDRLETALSYHEFLQHLKTEVK